MTDDEKIRLCAAGNRDQGVDRSAERILAAAGLAPVEADTLGKVLADQLGALGAVLARPVARPRRAAPEHAPPSTRARPARTPAPASPRPTPLSPVAGPNAESPLAYWNFRDRLATAIRASRTHPTAAAMLDHATTALGVNRAIAAEWIERFMHQVRRDMAERGAGASR